jgi:hypothetical protein
VLHPAAVGERPAEPDAQRAREGRLNRTGVGAGVLGAVRTPDVPRAAWIGTGQCGQCGREPRAGEADHVVQPGRRPAEPPVAR